jgi:HEAT repeat protein
MPPVKGGYAKLAAALKDSSVNVRLSAARSLWRVDEQQRAAALATLTGILKEKSPVLRRRAAAALGELGPEAAAAVPALQEAAGDADPSVRQAATTALKQIQKKS